MVKTATTSDTKSSKAPIFKPAISYRLSDQYFQDIGWTSKPNYSVVLPVVTMKAKFSHPIICPWFQPRSTNLRSRYPNGKTLFWARKDGSGTIYYPNGKTAVRIEKGGTGNYRTRLWVYSSNEVEEDGTRRPSQLCALFDSLGNGVVYDHTMSHRLVYNQNEGILLDATYGTPIKWKWHGLNYQESSSLCNEEDDYAAATAEASRSAAGVVLQSASSPRIDKMGPTLRTLQSSLSSSFTKSTRSEVEPPEKKLEKRYLDTDKMMPRSVSPVKPLVVRMNRYLSLRIYSQSEITLKFFAMARQTQLKIGILYNPVDKLKVTHIEGVHLVGRKEDVICPFEQFPPKTKSMLRFRKIVDDLKNLNLKKLEDSVVK